MTKKDLLYLAYVIIASFVLLIPCTLHGGFFHDEGLLGQTAERVLNGQVSHLDFEDPYTGGLGLFHALIFKIFGIKLLFLHFSLLFFILITLPIFYLISRRFLNPKQAALITFLMMIYSFPVYMTAMPTWYMCLLAIWIIYLILKAKESSNYGLIFCAGVCAGLAILCKINGVLLVIAGQLFFLYERFYDSSKKGPKGSRRGLDCLAALAALSVLFSHLIILVLISKASPGKYSILHFVIPNIAVFFIFLASEIRLFNKIPSHLNKSFLAQVSLYSLGSLIPILIFFLHKYSLSDWSLLVHGLIINPSKRSSVAVWTSENLRTMIFSFGVISIALLSITTKFLTKFKGLLITLGFIVFIVLLSTDMLGMYLFRFMRASILLFALFMITRLCSEISKVSKLEFLLFIFYFLFALIQIPFASYIYLHYTLPLLFLSVPLLLSKLTPNARLLFFNWKPFLLLVVTAISCYYARSANDLGGVRFRTLSTLMTKDPALTALPSRVGLWYRKDITTDLVQLIDTIKKHSKDQNILATPDCPEVYFFSGKENITPIFYESLSSYSLDLDTLAELLEEHSISLVVINDNPQFSKKTSSAVSKFFKRKFQNSKSFLIYTVYY